MRNLRGEERAVRLLTSGELGGAPLSPHLGGRGGGLRVLLPLELRPPDDERVLDLVLPGREPRLSFGFLSTIFMLTSLTAWTWT